MGISSFLAPVPSEHLDGALDVLKEKPFVAFGTDAFEFFRTVERGARVLLYRSHDDAEPIVAYEGIYRGTEGDPAAMLRLAKGGFRPPSTAGERWGMYWKCSDIHSLQTPLELSEIQLVSGKFLSGYPRGPLATAS